MTSHITGLVRTSFAILRQLRSVSRSLTRDAFEVAGPRTWNSLPATIRATKTLPAFKKQLKLYLIGDHEH